MAKQRKSTGSRASSASASPAVVAPMARTLFLAKSAAKTLRIMREGSTIKALMAAP